MAKTAYLQLRAPVAAGRNWLRDHTAILEDRYRERTLLHNDEPHILVIRERSARLNWPFFDWLNRTDPPMARRFRHRHIESRSATELSNVAMLVWWIADPVKERCHPLYERMCAIEAACNDRGIPIVNRAASLSNSIKSRALQILREAGLHTATTHGITRSCTFEAVAEAVGCPFIVRNDRGHNGYVRLIQTESDYRQIDWPQLDSPVALEFIETRSADGHYRKYRYVLLGDAGVSRHLVIAPGWCAHAQDRVRTSEALVEEQQFLDSANPYHDALNRGRQALGLDYVAFDYSLDATGRLIVWEPNPFPVLWAYFNEGNSFYNYQLEHMDRVFGCLATGYLRLAGLKDGVSIDARGAV